MLLAIDVGNTHTVLGLFDGDDLVEHWRVATEAHRTADEIAVRAARAAGAAAAQAGCGRRDRAVLDGAGGAARDARRVCALLRRRADGRSSSPACGPASRAHRQPQGGRHRPDRQRARRRRRSTAARASSSTSAPRRPSTRCRRRGSTSAARSRRASRSRSTRSGGRGAQLRRVELARPRSVIGRIHRRGAAVGDPVRLRRPGRRRRRPGWPRRSSGRTATRTT